MRILAVNLKRRPDRLAAFDRQMSILGLNFEVVEAVDAASDKVDDRFVPAGWAAVCMSHGKALRLAAQGATDTLVCEDDAVFDSRIPWSALLDELPGELRRAGLDLLQIGFVEPRTSGRVAQVSNSLREVRSRQRHLALNAAGVALSVVPYSFLPGTHAYIVRARLAGPLAEIFDLPWNASDGFMDRFARTQRFARRYHTGRLRKSLVAQATRNVDYRGTVDSDAATEESMHERGPDLSPRELR